MAATRFARGDQSRRTDPHGRFRFLLWAFLALGCLVVLRLGYLQIAQYGLYSLYASDQHELASKLLPTRGQILVRDRSDGGLHPLATNRLSWQVYAVPKDITNPDFIAQTVAPLLGLVEEEVKARIRKNPDDPYEPLAQDVSSEVIKELQATSTEGIGMIQSSARLYPERNIGGQLVGFVTRDEHGAMSGRYGIEGAYNELLAGTPGRLEAEKDAAGRRLTIGQTQLTEAVNGADVVLTIDRTVQYQTCGAIQRAVEKHSADGGSIVIMNPQTGAVIALCSYPDFNSAEYGKIKDLNVLNNPVMLHAYESGSVFKAFTLAMGLDLQKINPKSTYVDTGVEEIDGFRIKNADGKAYGLQTMTQVLDESLNTGTIFVQRAVGKDAFRRYAEAFGFGKKTGIELSPEAKGNISSLAKKGSIFAATASFGQGLTVTPIQLVAAYAALGNGGKLMRPYVVDEIIHPNGIREKTKPQVLSEPITKRTSRLISGMLTSVVENGHGKRAGVPGYWVAGKTGTAQVARSDGGVGYLKDVNIGSFAGYAPATDPKFAMLVKLDHPRDVEWAESSAAPLFGEMAAFLLRYYEVPPERSIKAPSIVQVYTTPSLPPTSTPPSP